ncbi:MAG: GDP-6-deoxy-D-mannose reductase [Actinobacteria bacterium ADurb.Bin346]|nr:MAG: GDP-6-deoxy-D-mannose reductase [Actinobacteria bacterium ADurb.Bin346]
MKVLITGACGFAGRHLIDYLLGSSSSPDKKVEKDKCLPRKMPLISAEDITAADITDYSFNNGCSAASAGKMERVNFIKADISIKKVVREIIKKIKPDRIYHLAGQPSVGYSWKDPVKTFEVNVIAGIQLLEAARSYSPDCRILIACTAEEYAPVKNDGDTAITENFHIGPSNPYAISKAAIDFFAATYQKAYGMPVFISRSFNHIGPGQSENFVTADFAKQIAEIEAGHKKPEVFTGNLEAYRDFLDVRDAVRAYCFITEYGKPGEPYNVCSGIKTRISDMLDMMISLSKVGKIKITVDKKKLRPVDVKSIYGDNTRIKNHTGWKPEYNIKHTLKDTLDWWRERSRSK